MQEKLQETLKRFIGVDLHTNKFNICELKENSAKREHQGFSICDEDFNQFTSLLDKNTYVMLEACTNAFQFAKHIQPFAREVIVADTHKLKIISESNKKTDKIDAEKIATVLKMQMISGEELVNRVYIPDDDKQALRGLFKSYSFLTERIIEFKNRIHSLLKENMYIFPSSELTKKMREDILSLDTDKSLKIQFKLFIEELESLEAKKTRIEEQIKLVGFQYYKQVEILTSIKGISVLSALAIMADICEINRFPNKKHLCSYLRTAPKVDCSNETIRIGKVNKFSRKLTIGFLTQSVSHFKKANPSLNRWYTKKAAKTKKGKVRMGACRKVITQIYSMLKNGEYHHFREEKNHEKKMNEYKAFLKKYNITVEENAA